MKLFQLAFVFIAIALEVKAKEEDGDDSNNLFTSGLKESIFKVIDTGLDAIDVVPIVEDGIHTGAKLCNVVPTVKCVVKATGQDCANLIVSKDQCRPMDMNFTFKYCNKEDREVEIFPGTGQGKTKALIDTIPVAGINANPVKPGQCRELTVTRSIDTCRKFFSASFEFNGRRGLDWRNGDYCYGFDFLRVFIKRPCALTSDVSQCKIQGQDCDSIMIPLDECNEKEPAEMEFTFCNKEKTPVKVRKQKFKAAIDLVPVSGFDLSDIEPKSCRTVVETREINTCKRFFSRRLNIEGWKESGTGDYCNGYDFERVYFRRPMDADPPKYDSPCKVTSQVTCKIAGTNTDCDDIVVPLSECEEDKEMTFEFEYCNLEESGFVDLDFRSNARVEKDFVKDLDISILAPGECRTHRETRKINTCKRFFSARLNIEGRRESVIGDYCGAFDFYRSYIKRPASDNGFLADECDIRSKVSCTIEETGEDCGDIVVPLSDCNEKTPMLFTFEYCNGEDDSAIDLRPEGSVARIETIGIAGLNFSDMAPKECRRLIRRREINTCKRFFSARLGVEGKRTEDGVYCYAWDFYREYIARFKKPSLPAPGGDDGPCAITSKVSCTFDTTGQACEDAVIPFSECEESAPATFIYEYCNFNDSEDIEFKVSNTRALIETDDVTSEFNLSNLDAGLCRRRVVRYNVNTCKRFISARLNIEGWRGGDRNDYCQAYDFLRTYFGRPTDGPFPPVVAPSPNDTPTISPPSVQPPSVQPPSVQPPSVPPPTDKCDISAKVSCTVDATGEPCDDITVALDECNEETPISFSFDYCNRESTSFVDLFERKTFGLVEMIEVDLDRRDMIPGECRTRTVSRKINTCKRFFSASLKVEGLRNGTKNDYCYAYDFKRVYVKRPAPPNPNPRTECDVSAKIECIHDSTNTSCDSLTIPETDCQENDPITFNFVMCSDDPSYEVVLRNDKTLTEIENISVENLDKSNLRPGECRRLQVKRKVNTCKSFFSAEFKVEGKRPSVDGFCFAYDFLRVYLRGPTSSPTFSPTLSPSLSTMPSEAPITCNGLTPEQKEQRILEVISTISDPEDFKDKNSPQSKARDWLIEEDQFDVFCANACSRDGTKDSAGIHQRYTIVLFYFATNGDDWITCGRKSADCRPEITAKSNDPIPYYANNIKWLDPLVSECLWGGLACKTRDNCIDRIEFEANNVHGELPVELEQLNGMRYLYLEGARGETDYNSGNLQFLKGPIPEQYSNLDQLIILDLNYNELDGTIPEKIYDMRQLQTLDINHNRLRGPISSDIGNLVDLRFLQLDNNEFTGAIPEDIANARKLVNADFHRNNFDGWVPNSLCDLLGIANRLIRLSSDCGGRDPEVQCSCCTNCFSDEF